MSKVLKVVAIVAVAVAVVVFAPAIGAALASVAGSLGITVAGSAIASYLVGMAITTALTAALTLFRKPPSMSNSMADRLNTSVNPTAPRKIVFGLTAAGNDVRFFETYGKKKDRYAQAIALASHRVNGIRGFYVENDLVWNGGYLVSHSDGIESVRAVTEGRPGNGFNLGSGSFWRSTASFTGCAYIAITWKLSNEAWPSGIPSSSRTIVEGCPLYDPRLDSTRGGSGSHRIDNQNTWGWYNGGTEIGRNPALALLTYLIGWKINGKLVWGMGIPAANIDFDSFKTYANICEEQVATQVGGSVQRYTCDGIFSTADSHDTVINAITAAMGSTKMVDVGGAYTLIGGYDDTAGPKVGLTLDDIVGAAGSSTPYVWVPAPASRERFNIVRGRFADPENLYQLSDWGDPIEQPALADEVPRTMNLDLGCVSRAETCQRIAKQFLLREYLTPGKFSATFGPNAFAAQVGSIVTLTIPQLGWNAKLFRVEEQAETHDMFYQMTLREESAAIYAWDREEKPLPANIRPTGYDPNDTLAPEAFAVSSQSYAGANNYNVSEVHVSWTPEDSGRVTGIQIYSRPVGVDAWTEQAALHDARSGTFIFTSNAPGIDLEVRARFRMSNAIYGQWVTANVSTAAVEVVDNSARDQAGEAKTVADQADTKAGNAIVKADLADGKATQAVDALKDQSGNIIIVRDQVAAVDAAIASAQAEVDTAKQEIADARATLGQAVTDARAAADTAKTDAANANAAATQVRTDLAPQIDAAKAEGTTARSEAKKASDDLAAEVTRAKGAEGTLTTKVGVAQSRADGAMTAISEETTQRLDGDASLGQRIDTVVAKANTDRGTFNTKISDEATTRADQDTAISNRLGVVEANYVTADDATEIANAKVSEQATTSASRDVALSNRISSIEADYVSEDRAFGFTTSEVQNEATARANAIGAVGQRIDGVIAQATTDRSDYTAKIRSEETARAAVDQALSDKVDVVEAKLRGDQDSGLAAQVRTEAAARVSGDTATATRTDSLEATRDYQRGLLSNNDLSPEARKSYGMDAPGSAFINYESNHGQVGWACHVKDASYIYFHNNHKIIKQAGRRIRATCWFYSNTANARPRIYWNDNNDVEGRYRGEGESGGSIGINGVVGVTGVWTKITSEITITDDWRQNIYAIFNADPWNGATRVDGDFYVSGMIIEDVTEVAAANARITDLATVTTNADGALAQRIQTVEANYVTNAQADAKVNAEAVTRAGETGALSSRIGSVETRYSGSGNLLGNTEFVTAAGWNVTHNGMAMGALIPQAGDYWSPRGETTLTMSRAGQPASGSFTEVQSAPFALEPNTFIQFYGRTASHRSRSWVSLFFRDENGNDAGYAGEIFGARTDNGGPDLSGWDYTGRQSIRVPGNARFAVFVWRVYDDGHSDPVGWLFHPYVGQAREGQTEWNPYSPGSGKQSFVATNARIEDVNTASASRDSAIGQRVDTTEAKLRGDQDSGILAAVRDETNTRVTQAGGLSSRIGVVETTSRNVATSYTAVSRGNGAVAKFGRGAGIYNVDGTNFTGGGRGYRVNVFDGNNTLIASNLYDTLAGDRGFSLGGAPEMASFLNGIAEGQAVIITTDDEPQSNRLSSGLVEAMERCGAGPLFTGKTFAYRGAYILVGQAGIGKGNGNEYYSGSVDSGPDAWIEARFDLLAGRPQLNGSGKAISETNAAIKDEVAARTTAVDAVSSRTATIEASYTAGGNMLSNTDFAYNEAGWNYAQEAATGSGRDAITGTNWWPVGMHPLVMGQENGSTNRGGFWWQDVHGIEVGQTYQASMFTASHRCDTQVYIDCFNNAGAVIANFTSPYASFGSNDSNAPLSSWARPHVNFVIPTGTSYIRFYLMKWGTYAGQANSYAWFLRPQLVHTRSGVTALVPYTPGSGNSANAATNARVDSEATTRANADAAQSGRISTTEAQLNGTQGSWMSGRITDVETASVNRDNAITSRTNTLESVALGGGSSARNDNFAFWKDGAQYPENWITWNQEGNWRTERQQGIAGSPYCVRTLNDYANVESGFYQTVFVYPGKWIVEVTAESDPSGFSGAGMTLHGQFNIDFLGDADTNGFTGDKVNAVRTWTKAFDFSQDFVNSIGSIVNFHAMHGWTGFNRYRAPKYMRWHKMSLRPADYGGAEAFRANARITEEANTRSSAISSLASKTSTLEVAMARGEYLNRNALFNEPWDGNGLPPGWGLWSQSGNSYYGRWPSGSGLYGQYAVQFDRQGTDNGFMQSLTGQFPRGYYVLDCEVRLEDGPTQGAGLHANFMNGYADQVNFYSEQDATETTGQRSNGNYKFTKLIWNGNDSNQINLHPMAGWSGLSGYTGFIRTIWFKAGIRPASVQEVKSGKVDNLSAKVTTTETAIANLNGKTQAYFSKSVAVQGAEAFIMANAINDAGQATSNVAIGGTNIALYNTQDGTAKRAMYLLAGNATFDGMITARTGIRIGDGTWQVAVSPKDFRVSNGTVVNYGYDLGRVPNITFGPCPVSLNTGEVYQAYADNVTSTGFTARLVIQGSPTAASQSTGGGYSYNGDQGYQVDKGGPDATNGTYTINASGTFLAQAYYDGSGDCVHIDAWTSPDKQAGDVQQGDLILILNEDGSYYEEQHVQNNYIASAHCVRITTVSGIQLTLSDSTPVTLRDLSVINVREVVGQELAVLDEGDFRWETVTTLKEIGLQPVAHISALDGTYAAGDVKGRMIFTHNIYYKP